MSDSSEICSSSGSSYSGRISSYPPISRPANRVQRFIKNLQNQFKRLQCEKTSEQGWHYLESSDSDSVILSMSSLLRAGSDEIVQIMNMVIQIPPGANNEIVMYETEDPTSSGNNAEGDLNIKFQDGSLAAILLTKKPAFINLNFPKLNELIESFSSTTYTEDEDEGNSLVGEADVQVSQDFGGNSCSVTKVRAEISVFKTGRATLSIGSKVFILAMAAKPKISKKVVRVDLENRRSLLGLIQYYIDVFPQEQIETD